MIDEIVSVLSQTIILFSLYFTCFWILVLLNTSKTNPKIKNYPSVTFLIPAYNEEEGIEKTIKSCLNVRYPGTKKIIVINDASKDRTLEIAKKYSNQVEIIDKKKNAGKASALNTGLKKVDTDFFAVVDADSEITHSSLIEAMKQFEREDEEKVGAVISKIMKPDKESGNMLETIQLIEYMMVGVMRFLSSSIQLLHLTPGVLSVYRTKLVKELGGFDPRNMTEDFELGVKVRKAGYLVVYSPDSLVKTETPSKFKVFLKQRIRWSRGFIQTHNKHSDIFFNRKYGLFGMYQFPMNVLGPIIYFLAIFAISFKVYKEIYEFIFKLIYTPDVINWFYLGSIHEFFLGLDPTVDFLIIISFLLFMVFFYSIIEFYGYNFFKHKPLKKFFAFILYIMAYNYIYIYVWIVSLKREIKKEDYSWGTK